jgi:hypothetical protein
VPTEITKYLSTVGERRQMNSRRSSDCM